MTTFLGIDPSLTATGLAVVDLNNNAKTHMLISSEKRGAYRLEDMHKKLRRQLDNLRPSGVVIEGYAMGYGGNNNPGRTFDIGEWGGIIRLELCMRRINTWIMPPANLKQFIAGNGAAKKDEVMAKLLSVHSIYTSDDNIADAYGLALAGRQIHVGAKSLDPKSKEALALEKVVQIVFAPPSRKRSRI